MLFRNEEKGFRTPSDANSYRHPKEIVDAAARMRFESGVPYRQIAKELNRLGYKTAYGKDFNHKQVVYMLRRYRKENGISDSILCQNQVSPTLQRMLNETYKDESE
jgi:hypothetical protein